MKQTLYLIRHCQATGQQPDAPLTPAGEQQAYALAATLASAGITQLVASPYARAVQSILPLAQVLSLPITTDARLVERVLSNPPIENWVDALRVTYEDFNMAFPGGETSRAATHRAIAAIEAALAQSSPALAIVTHGNLLSLILKHFNPALGFDEWQAMRNPDVYQVLLTARQPQIIRMSIVGA